MMLSQFWGLLFCFMRYLHFNAALVTRINGGAAVCLDLQVIENGIGNKSEMIENDL